VPLVAQGQVRTFLVRLGNDTIAAERIERRGNHVEGTIVRRLPQTSLLRYTVHLNDDGTVAWYEQRALRADGTPQPNTHSAPLKITFTGDSIVRDVVRGTEPVSLRSAAPRVTFPSIPGSVFGPELLIAAVARGATVHFIGINPQQTTPTRADVRLFGRDSAELVAGGFRTGFRLQNGFVTRMDGSLTTSKILALPQPDLDVSALATTWASRDASGQSMGVASTRDTINASVGDAKVWIDYGRPAKRGRTIWGALVPYDTTWRLGANAATQFRTDKDLDIGGVTVPAGTYTLFLYPSAQQSYLIVNTQTGQWGTVHDASKDLARIPVQARMSLPTAEERFTISVRGNELLMQWDRGGYGVTIKPK
jgi:hypothetical protein